MLGAAVSKNRRAIRARCPVSAFLPIHPIRLLTGDQMVTYNGDMDVEQVFKAVADPHRRCLLDALGEHDGQSLTQLCAHLPMSRFGVMKHLRILEEAGLITTRKAGREKRHYLNPRPLQEVAAWLDRYRRFWDARLDRLEDYLRELPDKEQSHDRDDP